MITSKDFTGKYTNTKDNEKDKILLTNDAYAIGEMIECLINKLEQARLSWRM